ncbi:MULTISPECIES: hypothetical protein [unclassified Clostridioides]|uniref:hypothetical protein n=1 Tax=unclassified Clostridioides TaxID=2635829 RepID=UPI001D11478B|nr:hypothetical protein [Clostridioides sp. ES-S-0171-01]MCC0688311.1 hypothetical protein [Clostridioides sp. ES-S-0056-01]MCC0715638.1 hypothetical protein [Clostridioides sp. ES-S-0077-01]UDN54441.1 hypothetical protein JJC02_16470 [Clostridioides sp. ES-S-0054-01]
MRISNQHESQYLFRCESDVKNKKASENISNKNLTTEKDNYLSNIMRQKQELNNRIKDLKERQDIYTKKINEAIRNLSKSEIRETVNNFSNVEIGIKNSDVEDENSTYLNMGEKREALITKELNEEIKDKKLNDKELEQKKSDEEDNMFKEDNMFGDLLLLGKTREELEGMLKNFINMTQEEIIELKSRIEKLDEEAKEYKQNSNTNIFYKTDEQKKHINTLV